MEDSKKRIFQFLDGHKKEIDEVSKAIWEYAELPMQEEKSARMLADWLGREGFKVTMGTSGMPTAFLAEYRQGSGRPVVAFLAEYDALAGNSNRVVPRHDPVLEGGSGHGCGHNLIGTGDTAAAIALKNEMARAGINGTIRVFGTPGEELLIAKVFMARDGLFDDCDVILTSHPTVRTAASTVPCYAIISTEFTFLGESCHMTSFPEAGRNALDAAQLSIIAANMRKKHMSIGTVLEYVIPDGGYQPNVVPDEAKVWYFVRHPDVRKAKDAYDKIVEAVKGAAIASGTSYTENFITGSYGYLANRKLSELLYENGAIVGHPIFSKEEKAFANEIRKNYGLEESEEPIHEGLDLLYEGLEMYGQDDGDASWINPLGRVNYAFPKGVPFHGWGFTAVSGSSIGTKGLMFAAKTLSATALDVLLNPDVLKAIKEEHRERTEGFKYKCLVPPEVKPMTPEFMKHHVKARW